MKNSGKKLLLGCSVMVFSIILNQQNGLAGGCIASDCTALGYKYSATDCNGADAVVCPFDSSKVFCKPIESYVMAAGDILFSDKTTAHYYTDNNKTPIGVVVDPSRRLAMALSCALKQWSTSTANNTNIASIPDKTPEEAKSDFNGKAYTKTIVNECGSSCPAAYYAYNYTTTGTSKGDWFLPSGGQLWLLEQNKAEIKMGLAKAGGKLPYGSSINTYIESSNEGEDKYDFKMAVYLDFEENYTSYMSEGNKYKSAYLDEDFSCPFIEF